VDKVNHSRRRPAEEVLDLIHTVMHQVRSRQHRILRAGDHDLTHMEVRVLGYLARHADATQRDMSRDTDRDKAQLARLIKGLRERALLASAPDPEDRRNQRLSLTTAGRTLLNELQQQSSRVASKATAKLSAAEVKQLVNLLRRVRESLGEQDEREQATGQPSHTTRAR
jgi:DNA-binding MarR family transcriptional regulator